MHKRNCAFFIFCTKDKKMKHILIIYFMNRGMEVNYFKEGKIPYNKILILILMFILSYILGSLVIISTIKYLNHLTIINTFYVMVLLYLSQGIIEILKMIFLNDYKVFEDKRFYFKKLLRVIIINLCFFIIMGIGVLGFLLLSLFFSTFKYLFIFLMFVCGSLLYIIYTLWVLYVRDFNDGKLKFRKLLEDKKNLFKIILIGTLAMFMVFILFNFLVPLKGIVFPIILFLDLLLNEIVRKNSYYINENI